MKQNYHYFGQAYGDGAYGSGTYSCTTQQQQQGLCTTATTGGGSSSSSSGGSLVNTGVAIAGIVTLACLIVFVTLAVRIWRRPKMATQEAAVRSGRDNHEPRQ